MQNTYWTMSILAKTVSYYPRSTFPYFNTSATICMYTSKQEATSWLRCSLFIRDYFSQLSTIQYVRQKYLRQKTDGLRVANNTSKALLHLSVKEVVPRVFKK